MTPSSRTPTTKQGRVLFVLETLRGVAPDAWPGTKLVHDELDKVQQRLRSLTPVSKQRETFDQLNAMARHEWVLREVSPALDRDNEGSHLRWFITDAGREALGRAMEAARAQRQQKEDPVEGATAQEAPASEAPWEGDDTPMEGADHQDAAPAEEEHVIGEDEQELEEPEPEDDNPPVNEGASQLTLAIGGPKPKSSILKVMSKQQKFGTTRQFKNLERIPFTGVLEVRTIEVKTEANGHVTRTQKAVITEFNLDGVELPDDD